MTDYRRMLEKTLRRATKELTTYLALYRRVGRGRREVDARDYHRMPFQARLLKWGTRAAIDPVLFGWPKTRWGIVDRVAVFYRSRGGKPIFLVQCQPFIPRKGVACMTEKIRIALEE
jgi:hypothetical protein